LSPYSIAPFDDGAAAHTAMLCAPCTAQLAEGAQLDSKRWFCLQQSIWSEHAPVQVLSWRLANRLRDESWARDLLEQVYLDEERLTWAQSGGAPAEAASAHDAPRPVDSLGATLAEGDSVTLIKDLDVKGAAFVAKRGMLVKNIHLIDQAEQVEARINGTTIVLKTMFLKKA